MTRVGFEPKDFDTFLIDGLPERMEAIQTRIQPKFQIIGSELTHYLEAQLGNEMYLHIAKHARRTVNPPQDTWLAVCDNKRGYKKHPHFQVGLFDDHLFIWLALIYELDFKTEIAKIFMEHFDEVKALPEHFSISLNHMKKDSKTVGTLEFKDVERFYNVKSAEFLVGLHLKPNNERVQDGDKLMKTIEDTVEQLIPFYRLAISARSNPM